MDHVGGLDLGQKADPSALAVLQKDGHGDQAVYTLMVLRRFELKTSYRDVVDATGAVMTTGPLEGAPLIVDETGVGRPVVEIAQERLTQTAIYPVMITSGHSVTKQENGSYHVPKKVLVSALTLVHQTGRLIVPRKLTHGLTLASEMTNFKAKITASANETFEAWRSGQHDDLVLAVALAVWGGETFCVGPWDATPDPAARFEIYRAPAGVFIDQERGPIDRRDNPDGEEEMGGGLVFPSGW